MFLFRVLDEKTAVDFIKTSTGYGDAGASAGDVWRWNAHRQQTLDMVDSGGLIFMQNDNCPARPLRDGVPLQIKAAGGIKDLGTALKFISVGADRLGMSSSVKVMEEWNAQNQTFTAGEKEDSATD